MSPFSSFFTSRLGLNQCLLVPACSDSQSVSTSAWWEPRLDVLQDPTFMDLSCPNRVLYPGMTLWLSVPVCFGVGASIEPVKFRQRFNTKNYHVLIGFLLSAISWKHPHLRCESSAALAFQASWHHVPFKTMWNWTRGQEEGRNGKYWQALR